MQKYRDYFRELIQELEILKEKSLKENFDPKELEMGIEDEMEHTSNKETAKRIAQDHLRKDPHYYSKMKKCGLSEDIFEPNDDVLPIEGCCEEPSFSAISLTKLISDTSTKSPMEIGRDAAANDPSKIPGNNFGGKIEKTPMPPEFEEPAEVDIKTVESDSDFDLNQKINLQARAGIQPSSYKTVDTFQPKLAGSAGVVAESKKSLDKKEKKKITNSKQKTDSKAKKNVKGSSAKK